MLESVHASTNRGTRRQKPQREELLRFGALLHRRIFRGVEARAVVSRRPNLRLIVGAASDHFTRQRCLDRADDRVVDFDSHRRTT